MSANSFQADRIYDRIECVVEKECSVFEAILLMPVSASKKYLALTSLPFLSSPTFTPPNLQSLGKVQG
jgi:hypothetical protein